MRINRRNGVIHREANYLPIVYASPHTLTHARSHTASLTGLDGFVQIMVERRDHFTYCKLHKRLDVSIFNKILLIRTRRASVSLSRSLHPEIYMVSMDSCSGLYKKSKESSLIVLILRTREIPFVNFIHLRPVLL